MKYLVGAAMAAVLLATGWEAVELFVSTISGNIDEFWMLMGIKAHAEQPAQFIARLSACTAVLTWLCILIAFWQLHQLIWARTLSFGFVGRKLQTCAYASFGFWFGSTLMFVALPALLIWTDSGTSLGDADLIPLGFETTFLILSLTFVTVGQTLERAEAVEDEMKHIL